MTRKRFNALRRALTVKMHAWAKANGLPDSGVNDKEMRPVSGKPLVNFGNASFSNSYSGCWNCDAMVKLRKSLGMEERRK